VATSRGPRKGEAERNKAKAALGHADVAPTSGYLQPCPGSSSGLKLDLGMFLRRRGAGALLKDCPRRALG